MTDNWGTIPEETCSSNLLPPSSEPIQPSVSVELPIDIVNAIHQHICQSGQTPTQAILDVLRSAVSQSTVHQQLPDQQPDQPTDKQLDQQPNQLASQPLPEPNPPIPLGSFPPPPVDLITEIYRLSARLAQLEALIPKLADLQGKSIAF